jgi:hypothetical protein
VNGIPAIEETVEQSKLRPQVLSPNLTSPCSLRAVWLLMQSRKVGS